MPTCSGELMAPIPTTNPVFEIPELLLETDTNGIMTPSLDTLRTLQHTIKCLTVLSPDEEPYEKFIVDPEETPLFPRVRELNLNIETTIKGLNVWIWNCPNMRSHRMDQVQNDEENQHPEWFVERCCVLNEFELHSE
ncbi:hypothetical protein BGZ83_008647 [Gryganskiella cystojenkinii]|nr:hypothetical protein BGZ83_008647 [Gryganskiella cystojenkinii]